MSGIITSQDWLRRLRSSDNYNGIDIVVDDSSAEYPNRKWIMPEDLTKAILKRLVRVRDDAPLIVSYSWTENVSSKWAVGNVNCFDIRLRFQRNDALRWVFCLRLRRVWAMCRIMIQRMGEEKHI